jgi:hypothetical protein
MYGLPHNVDLSFLKETELIQICVGLYQIQFRFDKNIQIFTTSNFTYVDRSDVAHDLESTPASTATITSLLGNSIRDIKTQTNGTLELLFSSNEKLMFHDNNNGYECYEIHYGEKTIIV